MNFFEKKRTYELPTLIVLYISEGCEVPFQNLAYTFGTSKCLSYHVKSNRRISTLSLPPKNYICSKKCLALSLLFVVPLKLISLALKIGLFVFSSEFRKMQKLLVEYHIQENKKTPPTKPVDQILNVPSDVWTSYGHLFSVQDLGRLTQVSKDFNTLASRMWSNKAFYVSGQEQNPPTKYFKDLFLKIENMYDQDFIKVLGGEEKILHFPSVTRKPRNIFSLDSHPQAKELFSRSSVIRTESCHVFGIHCRNTTTNKEGVLSITKVENIKTSTYYICDWKESGSANSDCYGFDYSALKDLLEKRTSTWRNDPTFSGFINLQIIDPPHSP